MAPPITVDIMAFLLGRSRRGRARAHQAASQPEKYRAKGGTTRRRFTAEREASTLCRRLELAFRWLPPIPRHRTTAKEAPLVEMPLPIARGNDDPSRAIRHGRV